MNKTIKKTIGVILLCIIGIFVFGCNKKEMDSNEKKVLNIHCYDSNYDGGTIQIIKLNNILQKYLPDYTINFVGYQSAPERRDALLSGEVDIADFGLISYITAMENDLPLTLISFQGCLPINLYSNNDDINNITDFKNGDIITITNRATNLHTAFLGTLKDANLDIETYDAMLKASPNAEALGLLSDGKAVSGSIFSFPTSMKADNMAGVHKVCGFDEAIKKYGVGSAFVTTNDFYKKNPEVIEAFLKAQEEAINLFRTDKENVAKQLASLYKIDTKYVLDAIKEMPPSSSLDGYDISAQLLYDSKVLKKVPKKLSELYNYENLKKFLTK